MLPELQAGGVRSEAVDPLAQARLFEALLDLFARTGVEAPVVLVIEDLHWADPSTRGFLAFLVRNIGRERLLLVATYRTDELHRRHPLRQFLGEVERLPAVERLELAPFSRRELARAAGGDSRDARPTRAGGGAVRPLPGQRVLCRGAAGGIRRRVPRSGSQRVCVTL